jgi:hypothetical protein
MRHHIGMQKKSFNDLSSRGKVGAVIAIAVSLLIVGTAERDLQRRSADEIRGRKLVWRFASLNALGALAYLRWGRRTA